MPEEALPCIVARDSNTWPTLKLHLSHNLKVDGAVAPKRNNWSSAQAVEQWHSICTIYTTLDRHTQEFSSEGVLEHCLQRA